MRATLTRALSRLREPLALRDNARRQANLTRSARSCRGLVTFSPVERVTRLVIPASIPTSPVLAGNVSTPVSTRIDTNHRPAASRETVTVDGSASSGSGRDQRTSNGEVIFASHNWPSRQRNPDRVYSAEDRDFFRDLNLGYFARFSENATKTPC